MKHVPNSLSLARILLTPVFLALLLLNTFATQLAGLVVFLLAAISDWLDGMIARRYKVRSELGRHLDPFADKVLVLSAFFVLPVLLPGLVPWWAVIVIALRDVAITALRYVRSSGKRALKTLPLAKTKTVAQLSYLILVLVLLVGRKWPGNGSVHTLSQSILDSSALFVFLMIVVALTVITGLMYFVSTPMERIHHD